MKRCTLSFAIILGWASAVWAAPPAPLTTLHAIHALSNAEADKELPVAFQATVIYYHGSEGMMFVQDEDEAIYVQGTRNAAFVPGDRILVRGSTRSEFHPDVRSDDITLLSHGRVPKPIPATFDDLEHARYDCLWVTVKGTAQAVDLGVDDPAHAIRVQLLANGGYIELIIGGDDTETIKHMLDAEIEVSGASAGTFDGKHQLTGTQLYVPSLANVRILKRAAANPWSLPATPMGELLGTYHVLNLTSRVRVHGSITYYQPGIALALQDGAKSVWISTQTRVPMKIGDIADAIGFPDVHDGFLNLDRAEIKDSGVQAPVPPQPSTWTELTSSTHLFDLVSIEGEVVTEVREGSQDEYVLRAEDKLFTAIYRHPYGPVPPPMTVVPLGSKIRVTGICILSDSNPFDGHVPFNILLRTYDDIAVVARPSMLSVRNLVLLVGLLLLVVLAVGARSWSIERKMRHQTAASAYIEQRRSRILEDINGSRPLAEVIEGIAELVSFKLHGAACWCQIADGARLGNCPPQTRGLRIVQQEVPGRSGTPLGTLFAALDPLAKASVNESEALTMGAGLATLAIETRRLYTDLRRRSEFDLLTDIHNRFSLDKHLDALIEEAREQAAIFGLIYIDLDDFKQVNDMYGHQAGDLYLQEVALRMKQQLRPHDMLARLGGDEFAALVPMVRNRAHAQEIAQRLERSFDGLFTIEGDALHGTASVGIALYPEDGVTKDSLLNAADAAMYTAKNAKKLTRQISAP
jgi:diguanylate cyclase (GGDEF)-like protein